VQGFIWPNAGSIAPGSGFEPRVLEAQIYVASQDTCFHSGLDIADADGTPVYADKSGTVLDAGGGSASYFHFNSNVVIINHGDGTISVMGHLQDIAPGITRGVTVSRGQLIGHVGHSTEYVGNDPTLKGTIVEGGFAPHDHYMINAATSKSFTSIFAMQAVPAGKCNTGWFGDTKQPITYDPWFFMPKVVGDKSDPDWQRGSDPTFNYDNNNKGFMGGATHT
jgi:hypothetical protein